MSRYHVKSSRRRDTRHFPSLKAAKLEDSPYKAIVRRFRERLILLEVLQHKRAPPEPPLNYKSEIITSDPTFEVFLNQLSWLCDYDKGGDSTSSIAVEATRLGPKYWLAANFDPNLEAFEFLRSVLEKLARLETIPLERHREIFDEILEKSLEFSSKKLEKYEKSLKSAIYFAKISDNWKEGSQEKRLLTDIETFIELETALKRCVGAFKCSLTTTLRKMHRKHRDNAPKDAGSAWYEVCHFVGRLGSWVRAVRVLVHFFRAHPHVLNNFDVGFVAAPKVCKAPRDNHKPKLYSVLRKMLPEDKDRATKLYDRLKNFRAFDFDAAFAKRWSCKEKYIARSHAELTLLDYFWRNDLLFFENIKYVAGSKRSCYCCSLFFDLHNSDIGNRPTHCNAWPKWCLPPGLEREDNRLLAQRKPTILERMTEKINLDILQLIEDGVPRRVRFKDSTTGIWTAPTLGFSAT